MQHVVLTLDIPNKNNRIYRKEIIENILPNIKDEIKMGRMFVTAEGPITRTVPINDIVAQVDDVFIDSDRLVVDFHFLKNSLANAVQEELNRGNIVLTPIGIGSLSYDDEQKAWILDDNYEIMCFSFTYHPF